MERFERLRTFDGAELPAPVTCPRCRHQIPLVDKPAPKDNEVLITIHATTVSSGDCNVRNFTFVTKSMLPIAKFMVGIGKPWKERVLGTEFGKPHWQALYVVGTNLTIIQTNLTNLPRAG